MGEILGDFAGQPLSFQRVRHATDIRAMLRCARCAIGLAYVLYTVITLLAPGKASLKQGKQEMRIRLTKFLDMPKTRMLGQAA